MAGRSRTPRTFSLELFPDGGTVRTDEAPKIGTAKGSGFSVDFQLIHEVHGSFEPGEDDNASLLVVRVVPFPKNPEAQFMTFQVQLSVQPVDNRGDADDIIRIVSFEPASEGSQFVDVYTTNEERERALTANATIPVKAASLGIEGSRTNTSKFTQTHLLKVKGRGDRVDPSLPDSLIDRATWDIHAANKEQGIGDSFTVALLIERPSNAPFRLLAQATGSFGTWSSKTRKVLEPLVSRKRDSTPLARFPMDRTNRTKPPGILATDLHRASTDNVMRTLEAVGLHIPEQAKPRKVIKDAVSSTTIELEAAKATTSEEVASSAPTPVAAASVAVAASGESDATTAVSPAGALTDPALVETLASILQQMRFVASGGQHAVPPFVPNQASNSLRIRRHREMANLYERLAELHRDEAKELQSQEDVMYGIVVVHGLATATGQEDEDEDNEGNGNDTIADAKADTKAEWPWQWHGAASPAARVAAFLSLHNTSSQTLEFCYRLDPTLPAGPADSTPTDSGRNSTEATLGLSGAIVRGLAIELLDALVDRLRSLVDAKDKDGEDQGEPEIVFVGRDFGGLAVSLARWLPKYYPIAAATTVLVFYETPRPVSLGAGSWESLANWLLFVSGRSQHFSTDWIRTTARMIEVVCSHFVRSEQLHHTIHVDCDNLSPKPSTEPGPFELMYRVREVAETDAPNSINDVVKRVGAAAHAQTPLGGRFIVFLQAIARVFRAPRRDRPLSDWKARSSADASDTLDALNNLPGLETWSTTAGFCGCFMVPPGDDAYPLFSKLQTSIPETQTGTPATVIRYVFDLYSSNTNNAKSLLASLCYQIFCSKPYLYGRLEPLIFESGFFEGYMTTWTLFSIFQALVSCPGAGQTVCVLWEMPGTEIPRNILPQLVSLTKLPSVPLKLAVLCSRPADALTELSFPQANQYHLPHRKPNLHAILENELTALLARRPDLAPVRATLKQGLLAQCASDRGSLFVGPWNTVKIAIRAWLSLITRRAVPMSAASLIHALDSMPDTLDSLHTNLLQQTPPLARPLMRSILSWLVLAQRPLQIAELTTALAAEEDVQTIDALCENSLTNIQDDMLLFLGSSVRIDNGGYLLLQPELAAFLKKQQQQAHDDASALLPVNAHLRLAKTCLTLLRLYKKHDIANLSRSITSHPFLVYATQNWAFHYSQGKQEHTTNASLIPKPFLPFFNDTELMVFWTRMRAILQQPEDPEKATHSQETVAAAVAEGCLDLMDCLLKQRPPHELETAPQTEALTWGLETAIQKGKSAAIKRLLDGGITTPHALHIAARYRHQDLVDHFAPTPESLRQEGPDGFLPLHLASESGALDIVEKFIRAGADVRAGGGPSDESPLHVASKHGHTDVIRRLAQEIEKDGDDGVPILDKFGQTPLHVACKYQQPQSVRTLLHVWAVRDSTLYDLTSAGRTALHLCAETGRADIVDILLKDDDSRAVDLTSFLDSQDHEGSTALHVAARLGHIEVVKALLACDPLGSLTTTKDEQYNFPIHLASMNGHADVVKVLLTTESAREQLIEGGHGEEQWYPIHLATRFGHIEVVRLLAKAYKELYVSLDLFDFKQRSVLHFAAGRGHVESALLLVDNEATVDIVDDDNATPLWLACRYGFEDVAKYLVECKSSVSLGTTDGITPLLSAALGGKVSIMRLLVRHGAKWSDKDKTGRSAVHYAVESGSKDAVACVLQHLHTTEANGATQDARRSTSRVLRRSNTLTLNSQRLGGERELATAALEIIREHAELLLGKDDDGNAAIEGAATGDLMIPLLEAVGEQHGNLDEELQKMLRIAADVGHFANVTYLIKERHVSPDAKDSAERTALSLAAEKGHLDVVKFLALDTQNEQDSEGRTPLFYAAIMGHMEVVTYLLSIAVDASNDISRADKNGLTPLYIAVSDRKLEAVKVLLANGADPNVAEGSNMTPLHIAAFMDDTGDFVRCLAQAEGVDGHAKDKYGRTPLFMAAYYGKVAAVEVLLDCKWPANFAHGVKGEFPLHVAYDNDRIIKLLINRGEADVNQVNRKGRTPLHIALDFYAYNVPLLLQNDADPSIQDNDGDTALHVAAKAQSVDLMKDLIKKAPASLSVKNKKGYNVLLMAVAHNNTSMVEYFLGLDDKPFDLVGDRDNNDLTAIEIALKNNDESTFRVLLDAVEPINDLALMQRTLTLCASQIPGLGAAFAESFFETATMIVQKLASESPEEDPFAYLDVKVFFDAIMALEVAPSLDGLPKSQRDACMAMRDKHGWTWSVLSASLAEDSASGVGAEPDEATLPPTTWTTERKYTSLRPVNEADILELNANLDDAADAKSDADPDATDTNPDDAKDAKPDATGANPVAIPDAKPGELVLEWTEDNEYGRLSILTDHPIPYGKRFFFSVRHLEAFRGIVTAGVGYSSSPLDRLPGWGIESWGFHGDDGGFFHDDGQYDGVDFRCGVGDTLGVYVDTVARAVFYSINGEIIPTGFHGVCGRLFPIVGVATPCKVILTLGSQPGTDPFKDEEGNEQMDKVKEWFS